MCPRSPAAMEAISAGKQWYVVARGRPRGTEPRRTIEVRAPPINGIETGEIIQQQLSTKMQTMMIGLSFTRKNGLVLGAQRRGVPYAPHHSTTGHPTEPSSWPLHSTARRKDQLEKNRNFLRANNWIYWKRLAARSSLLPATDANINHWMEMDEEGAGRGGMMNHHHIEL